MHCTNCKTDRSSRYSSCNNSCGSGICSHVCSYCGQHTLIEYAVERISHQLSISNNNPLMNRLQRLKADVEAGRIKEFTVEITQGTVSGYYGPERIIVYNKNSNGQF